jgi:hypothetical protein
VLATRGVSGRGFELVDGAGWDVAGVWDAERAPLGRVLPGRDGVRERVDGDAGCRCRGQCTVRRGAGPAAPGEPEVVEDCERFERGIMQRKDGGPDVPCEVFGPAKGHATVPWNVFAGARR